MPIAVGGRTKKFFRPNNDMRGMPDLVVMLKSGKTLWVETKSDMGRLSEHQKKFMAEMNELGHHYHVVRSIFDLESILLNQGITHWAIGTKNASPADASEYRNS